MKRPDTPSASFTAVRPVLSPSMENGLKTDCFFGVGHLVLGLASGLEAFSREPPCGSFGALAVRQTPETRGTAWEFLSYYPILPSRYLRDPFTTSRVIPVVSTHTQFLNAATKYAALFGDPSDQSPFALRE